MQVTLRAMTSLPITLADVKAAATRIQGRAVRTPCLEMEALSHIAGVRVFAKCELFQRTGSFKYRGAAHAVSRLPESTTTCGVATHSSGNHGQALAFAAREKKFPCHVVMPHNAPLAKRAAVEKFGAHITLCEPTLAARENMLAQIVAQTGATVIPPYNHVDVMAGQGTMALEILADVDDVDAIVVPVGGGGLISGIAVAAKGLRKDITILGAEPAIADDAARSKSSGICQPSTNQLTIADGLRGALGSLTFPVVQQLVDEIQVVGEDANARPRRLFLGQPPSTLTKENQASWASARALSRGLSSSPPPPVLLMRQVPSSSASPPG